MAEKVKTTIVVDQRLWREFKSRVVAERGLKSLSQAVEEALEDEVSDVLVAEALEQMLRGSEAPQTVEPVKPRVATDAGRAVRELRESRS